MSTKSQSCLFSGFFQLKLLLEELEEVDTVAILFIFRIFSTRAFTVSVRQNGVYVAILFIFRIFSTCYQP